MGARCLFDCPTWNRSKTICGHHPTNNASFAGRFDSRFSGPRYSSVQFTLSEMQLRRQLSISRTSADPPDVLILEPAGECFPALQYRLYDASREASTPRRQIHLKRCVSLIPFCQSRASHVLLFWWVCILEGHLLSARTLRSYFSNGKFVIHLFLYS